jgi:signal transduction histidine kinase
MEEGVALAPGGAPDGLEAADRGPVTEPAGSPEVEAMRRRLLRLAFDVHDGPMQELIGIGWRLQLARDRAIQKAEGGEPAALAGVFDEFAGDLGCVEKGLRSLMLSLEHNAVSQRSLRVPVDEHVAAFERHGFARVEVSVTGDVEPRTDSQRIALERVLRESLSNIAKHAHAEHVAVSLRGTDESIRLEIRDDGCGFVPDAAATCRQHVGIRAMRERLRLLGGELTVDSRVGGPTVVTARILKWQASDDVESIGRPFCS